MSAPSLRVVHCLRAPVGGAFRHVRDLISAQRAEGHAVGLICDSTTGGDFAEMQLDLLAGDLELGLVRIPMRRTPSPADLLAMRRAYRDLKAMAPDVLHGHGAKGGTYARLLGTFLRMSGLKTRRFYSPHGGSLHYPATSLAGRTYFTVERTLERFCDGLCFVSQYEADQYASKVHPPRIAHRTVHNGLRPEEFAPVVPAPDARDFLFIGEFRDLKGPDLFLLALTAIGEASGLTPTAHMVGPGDDRSRYKEMAEDLGIGGTVTIHAPRPAREAFAMARAVVIPSRAESLPYIVLEAIAAGLPVITTRVGGIPEIFAGSDHDLVAPGDATALATAMQRVLHDPITARNKAQADRARIADAFSLARMSQGVLGLYGEGGVRVEQPVEHAPPERTDNPRLTADGTRG
ncbi:glycosyltransferase involved in cell wall biosynthesis [Breoghania corrubedonensis]|uniref:Glycosyltransferase involved in cell wall biosynthesis n=1 Tax=Breoghania corrubedonensis TaxID=665038 RepID=A0A2T5VAA1_9HYPH|nr:glycosyltransferase [Breoghania corrubedonensis]PTW60688.1 glycosyltransferase involved in cell wall biosynthesis [Breoghania corrubedonensis]